MRIAGFTLVSHAVRLDFPIVPAIQSLLEVCDDVVVNVGPADDGTLDLLATIRDRRMRIVRGAWDARQGGAMLAVETNRALAEVTGDWAIYLQADEVLHEADTLRLRECLGEAGNDPKVQGLLFDYLHFYGSFRRLATNRTWIRQEVRAIRPGSCVRSFAEAQGFRALPGGQRVRARPAGCRVFHYGWARPIPALNTKREVDHALYHATDGRPMRPPIADRLSGQIGLIPYTGTHPAVAMPWIAEREGLLPVDVQPVRWNARQVQVALLHALERLTGWRPFEFRNYTTI
jgi:hypothetical protein